MKSFLRALPLIFLSQNIAFAQQNTVTYLQDDGNILQDKAIDINHIEAFLHINAEDTLVTGKVSFTFKTINPEADSVVFWSPDIDFSSVKIPGKNIQFREDGDNLVVGDLRKAGLKEGVFYEIIMEYRSKPRYDLFFIGWNEPAVRPNKQVWAHRPFHWLPYYGDRLTTDFHITFDARYQVMTNGVRESVTENSDGTKTWHYSMHKEHPFFSTCLVAGDYKFLEMNTSDELPLELWYYSWQDDHAEPTYRFTPLMFDFFNDEFGFDYPYELYREAPVEDYLYGAMETTTSTVFGDYLAVNERGWDGRNYVNVNAHELAHQWFGNCFSHQRNSDVWLTESFATYYAKMFEKEVFGADYYQWVRLQEFDEALEAAKKDNYPVGHSRGGRARWYPKGSLVLDMLRDVLGDEAFKAAISHYTNTHAFSEVESREFFTSVYEATGVSLDWFFDEWILKGGEPGYDIGYRIERSLDFKMKTVITVTQNHSRNELTGLFRMPVNFEVHYEDGSYDRKTQWIEKEFSEVVVDNPGEKAVSFVLFDPGRKILKTVSFPKSFEELSSQALKAPDMIDRYDALVSLRQFSDAGKVEVLARAWEQETFHLTRCEIMKQIFKTDSLLAMKVYASAIADPDPLVRRCAVENIGTVPESLKAETEKKLIDISYIVVEKTLDLLCRSFPDDIPRYLEATKNETGWRGRNIRMKWLEIAIEAQQREYLGELTDYAGPAYEFETRINAFSLLRKLNYLDKKSAYNLIDGILYWNYKVSNAAKDVLLYFYKQNRYKILIDSVVKDERLSDEETEKVRKMLAENK